MPNSISIPNFFNIGDGEKLFIIAGPCQIESLDHSLQLATKIKKIAAKFPVNIVFKASFDKANRTSLHTKRGLGVEEGLRILEEVRRQIGLPVLTDVHSPEQARMAGEVVDILQTPAFLCRQTDLLIAAGATGKPVNIKKGQFLSPEDMRFSAEKVASGGSSNILFCERGTTFGYRDLVVDMRSFSIMKEIGYPVVFDCTHSVQQPGGQNGASGGQQEFILPLLRAAVACGVDGLFIETHEDPKRAPSDSASMLPLEKFETALDTACRLRAAILPQ